MIKSLAHELLTLGLLSTDDAVVVGVSGGADSMALLHLFLSFNRSLGWRLRLSVAHLNHRLREEASEQDAVFVQAAADGMGIPCHADARDIRTIAASRHAGLEEVGREERYRFFERVCLQSESRVVVLAHHADDNAETVFQRIIRGTGIRGLTGIPRFRPLFPGSDIRLLRPLLRLTRAQLRRFLEDEGIAFREDATNAAQEPTRNRIRNVLLTAIERDYNPQFREALLRLREQAEWVDEYLKETVQRTFETLVITRTDQSLALNVNALARKDRIVQTELVRLAYRSFGLGEQDLAFTHMMGALDLIADPSSGKQLQLPLGITVEKRYHQLVFSRSTGEVRETIAPEVVVHLPGGTVLPLRRLEVECEIIDAGPDDIPRLRRTASRHEEFMDLDSVHPPLVVRSRRPGDRFMPLGAPGSKKISDFLADAKVEPQERKRIAILCDKLGPVWVIGQRIDDRVKLTALTRRVLRIRARVLDAPRTE